MQPSKRVLIRTQDFTTIGTFQLCRTNFETNQPIQIGSRTPQKSKYDGRFDGMRQQVSSKEAVMLDGDTGFGNPMKRRRDGSWLL